MRDLKRLCHFGLLTPVAFSARFAAVDSVAQLQAAALGHFVWVWWDPSNRSVSLGGSSVMQPFMACRASVDLSFPLLVLFLV